MKFSRSLVFNCVPEWAEHYISYKSLRKLIEKIECAEIDASAVDPDAKAGSPPAGATAVPVGSRLVSETEAAFAGAFNEELRKVSQFYREELARTTAAKDALLARSPLVADIGDASTPLAEEARAVYLLVNDLRDFLTINNQGFIKIIRKHDKHARNALDASIQAAVDSALPLSDGLTMLGWVSEIEELYARAACNGSRDDAALQLRNVLREKLVMARSSVWQEMVALERKVSSVHVLGTESGDATAADSPIKGAPVHHKKASSLRWTLIKLAIVTAIFVALLVLLPVLIPGSPAEFTNCIAMSVFIIALWAGEIIPLYATAMLIPLLMSVLQIVYLHEKTEFQKLEGMVNKIGSAVSGSTDDSVKEAMKKIQALVADKAKPTVEKAAKHIIGHMFDSKILQLLGGFAISAAATKLGIARAVALKVIGLSGGRPSIYMLYIMILCVLFSALISNVATPVLLYSIMQSTLRALPLDSDFAKQLILAVCFASNIGGMITPISSPQDIIAFEELSQVKEGISFGQWVLVATPVCVAAILGCWAMLILCFRGSMRGLPPALFTTQHQSSGAFRVGFKEITTIAVTLVAVVLWCIEPVTKKIFGPAGIVALIPLGVLFGFNILTKDDFNSFPWNVAMLAMGGTVLGQAMQVSGVLSKTSGLLSVVVFQSRFLTTAVISLVLSAATCFISHSVGAIIFVPLVKVIVQNAGWNDTDTLHIMLATAFACSAGMAMPVSSFPNIAAASQENGAGRPFVTTGEFIKFAAIASGVVWVAATVVGYPLMLLLINKN